MPHLVKERRVFSGMPPFEKERRRSHRMSRWGVCIPKADLLELSLASMTYRLALFGLDADASPLLVRSRKRGN